MTVQKWEEGVREVACCCVRNYKKLHASRVKKVSSMTSAAVENLERILVCVVCGKEPTP
jgi:hypothetical protein